MNIYACRFLRLTIVFISAAVSVAAQSGLKYGYEYKCGNERVVVFYCRNDSGQPVPEVDNYCAVEYPDRPRRNPQFPVAGSVVRSEMVKQVAGCSGPAASDPAIAKANAAKVDTVVFGIQLGDPFSIPACPIFQIGGAGQRTCFSSMIDQVGAIAEGLGGDLGAQNVKIVYLGVNECPSWVNECTLAVTLYEGKVGAVGVFTKGPSVDKVVQNVLAEKYGQWKYVQKGTVTHSDPTKPTLSIIVRYWELPGLFIQYQPIWSHNDGDTPNVREGIVRVETETARATRNAAPNKPKAKM